MDSVHGLRIRRTDRRYVFQRLAEAARLQARPRDAKRTSRTGRMRRARVHRFSAFAAIAPHCALRPSAARFIRMSYKRTVA
ncbi:hypothetical protein DBB31_07820 [Burkholderia multivorans]|nr:hypothetical protein DBB31_07820 [Burkholderia multivorans]